MGHSVESHMYPLVQRDGTDRWDSSTDYGTAGHSVESHVYPLVQWDGTDRWDSSMDYMGQWVSPRESHVYPLVQRDGTDRWDSSMDCGTVGQSEGIPRVPIGTTGWDRQVG